MLQDMIDEHIYTKWHKPVQNMITAHFQSECGYKMIYKTLFDSDGARGIYFASICNVVCLIPNTDMVSRVNRQRKDRRTKRKWLDKDMLRFHNIHNYSEIITSRTYCQFDC
jgi:hypothetical protein